MGTWTSPCRVACEVLASHLRGGAVHTPSCMTLTGNPVGRLGSVAFSISQMQGQWPREVKQFPRIEASVPSPLPGLAEREQCLLGSADEFFK